MIELDGSMLEGGGQILRMAVAYSSLLSKPVKVYNIRQGRSEPGLKPQHMKTLEAVGKICNADLEGLYPSSREISFKPGKIEGGSYHFDIGTAGSISLMLQCISPIVSFADSEVDLRIIGGTNVRWSPPIHVLDNVIWNAFRRMGFNGSIRVKKHGFYPKGGGIIEANIKPIRQIYPLNVNTQPKNMRINGISLCSRLPKHVAVRQAKSASDIFSDTEYGISIKVNDLSENVPFSPGSVVCLWVDSSEVFVGSSCLGERGKRAEKVGAEAATEMLKELNSGCCVDYRTADNLILWASLAKGETTFTTSKISLHTETAIELAKIFTGASIEIKSGKCPEIRIRGIGLER